MSERDPNHPLGRILDSTMWQGRYWWDQAARRHVVSEMPLDGLLALMTFLEDYSTEFFLADPELSLVLIGPGDRENLRPPAEVMEATALDWMRITPLFVAVVAAAERHLGFAAPGQETLDG